MKMNNDEFFDRVVNSLESSIDTEILIIISYRRSQRDLVEAF